MADEPTRLLLQVQEELRLGHAGVAHACVDVCVVGGKDALHSFCLFLNKPIAIISQEKVALIVAVINVEVLDA